ncbi:hypothetical protein MFMK1_000512 [Metallumcola ferriviriculae]|uniref:Uncharacterized protein n=1 Tax=Metallumcola ferriviriculae TaxID=3039180 RepID=A0AAU0UHG2_9FIRM|nr:hypothetical protein MFMK1_000512 [Desulfitibacteraceae bacterium MK1]
MVAIEYPWYMMVKGSSIEQGDIIRDCPVIKPNIEVLSGENTKVTAEEYDVVVMSQSCDLQQRKVELVLLCPIFSLDEIIDYYGGNSKERRKRKEAIKKGQIHHQHLLHKYEDDEVPIPISVVDFSKIFSVPIEFLMQFAEDQGHRVRLLPPYREHLSQSFAKFFMRVGLPTPIKLE